MPFASGGLFQGEIRLRSSPKIASKILKKDIFDNLKFISLQGAIGTRARHSSWPWPSRTSTAGPWRWLKGNSDTGRSLIL